ncbi:Tripeptidyl-peptidase II protein [Dioscorea alata]|uniref:Tripeptidyl-peptidase II protein n=1 Tax=Dioscorea alata TaxID=55571 RepID=A0ACB7WH88_DIOAL|nr:Tripeptidyl-peptidase II protein [Dioscorea alata]
MERFFQSSFTIFFFFFFFTIFSSSDILQVHAARLLPIINENGSNSSSETKVYIIHVAEPNNTEFLHFTDKENWYKSFLPNTSLDSGDPRLLYSYHRVITGFAAKLTDGELKAVKSRDGFVYAQEDQTHILHTTNTPTYLKLHQDWDYDLWASSSYGAGKIIGVIDSGIDPDHPSFKDDNMPQPPQAPVWNGQCYWANKCNRKLIGIRAFRYGWTPDPYDRSGHGTHVASTAAGNFVDNANVLGEANGRASGMAPLAHLSIYKVLYRSNTGQTVGQSADILAGIDWAIRDGVHILQMSLGAVSLQMFHNPVAIGSFAAMRQGIVPCAAAGNDGPTPNIIANDAPWIFTVGAASTDRRILTTVNLGDGTQLEGEGGYQPDNFPSDQLSLVYPGADGTGTPKQKENRLVCNVNLKAYNVAGKLVVCWNAIYDPVETGKKVKKAGGVGMILINTWPAGNTTSPEPHVLPVANVGFDAGQKIVNYINSTANPTASMILGGTQLGVRPSPAVASFSCRGPSKMNYGIIKPDIIAPGVNILAAWPQRVGPSPTGSYSKFKFLSGTSMATPHVSGIVALLMNLYPSWSPARIKSALMTTAYALNTNGEPIKDEYSGNASVYAMGSGHVDPLAAVNPGLVYDLQYYNYVHYLCGTGMADSQLSAIIRTTASCSQINGIPVEQLNYPSFSVKLGTGNPVTVTRIVTNVGDANSVYQVEFDEPEGVNIAVNPTTLQFSQKEERLTFEVKFTVDGVPPAAGMTREGQLSWVSPTNLVRSPIVVTFI